MTALSYTRSWARIASSTRNVGSMIVPSTGCPSIAVRTRAGNWLRKPLGRTRPNVFRMPRTQFFSVVICDTIWARATNSARTAWQSSPFTVTSRYQPTRMICARPRASLASVLLTFSDSAALAWRASTQITGRPAPFNSWNSQLDNCPLSSPIRTAWGACCLTAVAIASGVESTRPRHTILPASSMTQIEVSFRDTSRPTYWLLLDMVPLHWRCRDQYVTSPAITPCPDLRTISAAARSGGQGWPVFGPPLRGRAASWAAASRAARSVASGSRSAPIEPSKSAQARPSKTEIRLTGTIDDVEFHDFVFQQPQGPARASLGRLGTSQGNQFGFLLAVENPRYRRCRAWLAAQHRLEALLH